MLPEFAAFIAAHWLQIAAVGVFGGAVGLFGVYAPVWLAAVRDLLSRPLELEPLTDEEEAP